MPRLTLERSRTAATAPFALLATALALSACALRPASGPLPAMPTPARLEVHTTAQGAPARLALTQTVPFATGTPSPEPDVDIVVHPGQRFQTLLGIGGAITDASAEVFARLPAAAQTQLLRAYFDPEAGIGYTLLRTTIHSSDFSSASYTYVADGDAALASFDVAPDRRHRIPMIRAAIQAAGGQLTTYVSPWSAPGWMKDTGRMVQGGSLRPEFAASWANYMTRFIHAYEREGIPIWGLTVQNEPLARQTWESMIYSAEQERDFVRDHLGPTLARAGLGDRKLIVWDHNRDLIKHRADVILSDPAAAKYVWGVGFHWYETWDGTPPMHASVAATKQGWPGIEVLLTEATVEHFDPARLQFWPNAERYGRQIIGDFNAGSVGWTDWNILLDERGGPNHVGNYCFAPVHADSATGSLTFTPTFAYLGHFSKFIRPGARRISAVSSRTSLHTTAFVNPDGRLAIVVLNDGDRPLRYVVRIGGHTASVTIPARAIQTLRSAADALR